ISEPSRHHEVQDIEPEPSDLASGRENYLVASVALTHIEDPHAGRDPDSDVHGTPAHAGVRKAAQCAFRRSGRSVNGRLTTSESRAYCTSRILRYLGRHSVVRRRRNAERLRNLDLFRAPFRGEGHRVRAVTKAANLPDVGNLPHALALKIPTLLSCWICRALGPVGWRPWQSPRVTSS